MLFKHYMIRGGGAPRRAEERLCHLGRAPTYKPHLFDNDAKVPHHCHSPAKLTTKGEKERKRLALPQKDWERDRAS